MSVIGFSGFEAGDNSDSKSFGASGTISFQQSVVDRSAWALRINPTGTGTGYASYGTYAASGAPAFGNVVTSYIRVRFQFATAPAANDEYFASTFDNTASRKIGFRLNSAKKIAAYNSAGTLLATGATVLSPNTWYLIEWKCGTGATAAWELKINGISEISGTGNLSTNNAGFNRFGKDINSNGQSVDFYYDNYLWSDSGYPGDGISVALKPSANGTYQTFTIGSGSGSHYQIVGVIPYSTSYLKSSPTLNNKESEQVQTRAAAGITVASVNCVSAYNIIENFTFNNETAIILLLSNGTASTTTGWAVGAARAIQKILNTDPATSAAWLPAALDTLEIGSQVGIATDQYQFDMGCVMVDYVPGTPSPTFAGCFIPLLGVG